MTTRHSSKSDWIDCDWHLLWAQWFTQTPVAEPKPMACCTTSQRAKNSFGCYSVSFCTAYGELFQKSDGASKYWEDAFKILLRFNVGEMFTSEIHFWFHFNLIFIVLWNIQWAEIKIGIFDLKKYVYFKMVYATIVILYLYWSTLCNILSTARSLKACIIILS